MNTNPSNFSQMIHLRFFSSILIFLSLAACQAPSKTQSDAAAALPVLPTMEAFSASIAGKPVGLYILQNEQLHVAITNYGGRIVSLFTPNTAGEWTDVIMGFDSLAAFQRSTTPYYGALIGRYGNRIAQGQFTIDGAAAQLPLNNGPNHLHGGPEGFHNQVWEVLSNQSDSLKLRYVSPDGDMGYPGELSVTVTYYLDGAALGIRYEASTQQATHVNLTNHAYFNLNGSGKGDILSHRLQILADRYLPVDSTLIPSGSPAPVVGSPFDFLEAQPIGARIEADDEQLGYGLGYDHCYVLKAGNAALREVATLQGDLSGILMTVETTEPGLQFYSGNFMDGQEMDKFGNALSLRTALCLETQHFPDSPNQSSFPSTLLRPGERYESETRYRFELSQPE